MKRLAVWCSVFLAALALSFAPAHAQGPVILSGMDPEDHGSAGTTMIGDVMSFVVTNSSIHAGGTAILMLGGNPTSMGGSGSNASAIAASRGLTLTHITGAAITAVNFSAYDAIYMPTSNRDISGGLSATDVALINGRAGDIANFVNSGGGLAAFAQNVAGGYGWFPLGSLLTQDLGGGGSTGIALTPDGAAILAPSATAVQPFHTAFLGPAGFFGLDVLATESGGARRALIIGGLNVVIAGQLTLAPPDATNPTGTQHTVTATAVDGNAPNPPLVGVTVNFSILSGPNAGESGSDVTDANGEATFTYVGDGGAGIDMIQANMVDPATSQTILSNTVRKEWIVVNLPPICDAGGPYTAECVGAGTSVGLDASGSSDPDVGDVLTYSWTTDCPGASFDDPSSATPVLLLPTNGPLNCTVTCTVNDGDVSSSCTVAVNIVDTTPPVVTLASTAAENVRASNSSLANAIKLWPPNHDYHTITVEQCLASVVDACEGAIDLSQVQVKSVSSDEAEDDIGTGDGNTLDDIVIVCPNTVQLRAEREGTSNGRVYTIVYQISDASGNKTEHRCYVTVPHSVNKSAVAGPGSGYTETGCSAGPAVAADSEPAFQESIAAFDGLRVARAGSRGLDLSWYGESAGEARLEVFDLGGRRVQSQSSRESAGPNTLHWNGSTVENGIYFIRLRSGSRVLSAKVVWMR